MGSGKSYECVRSVILPAIEKGRRVVTNIEGVDSDAIRAYLHEKKNLDLKSLGHVVHCTNDQVFLPDFFPFGEDKITFCKPGDLICIDEAWRFFGTDKKLLEEHKIFFREHRHYINPESKVSCDLVLMVQDIGDLHRSLKLVVELNFRTTKLKNLGRNSSYRVDMWEGYKQLSKNRAGYEIKNYDKQIFPLYSSYSGGEGKELQVDGRQNQLTAGKLIAFVLALLCLGVGIYFTLQFFNPDRYETEAELAEKPENSAEQPTNPTALPQPVETVSEGWRVIGFLENADSNSRFVVLSDGSSIRLESAAFFSNPGRLMLTVGDVDGQKINARGAK